MSEITDINLGNWMIFRVNGEDRFFLAGDAGGWYGTTPRVSSLLQTFDVETMSGTTESGRRYYLKGDGGNGLKLRTAGLLYGWLDTHGYTDDGISSVSPTEVGAAFSLTEADHLVFVDWAIIRRPDGVHAIVGKTVSPGGSLSMAIGCIAEFDSETGIGFAGTKGDTRFRLHGDGTDLLPMDTMDVMDSWIFGDFKVDDLAIVSPQDLAHALSAAGPKQ